MGNQTPDLWGFSERCLLRPIRIGPYNHTGCGQASYDIFKECKHRKFNGTLE